MKRASVLVAAPLAFILAIAATASGVLTQSTATAATSCLNLTAPAPTAGGPPPPGQPAATPEAAVVAARAAKAAGFPRDQLVTAVAVAGGESEWNRQATNANTDGSTDYGLWQINSVHASVLASGDWRDPAANARMAYAVWQQAGGWSPWVAHHTGRHLEFVNVARLAVAHVGSGDDDTLPADPPDVATPIDFGCDPGDASGGGRPTDAIPCSAGTDGDVQPAPDGVSIRVCAVGGIVVDTTLAPKLAGLLAAAQAAGLRLGGSGYRSHLKQIELRREHCGPSSYAIWEAPAGSCSPPTARPGQSMHEWGLAIDMTNNGRSITSHGDPAWVWLNVNAARYGLKNLPSEPWHWSTNGR